MRDDDLLIPRSERWAVSAYFWLVGVTVGAWVARIPEFQQRLELDDGRLGLVLLMSALGALAAMPVTGWLARWVATRWLAWGSAGSSCCLLPLIAWAPTVGWLMVILTLYGAAGGVQSVVINALAIDVEKSYRRPILSSFHGLFSLGGLIGALVAAGCLASSIAPLPSLLGASLGIAATYLVAAPWLPWVTMPSRRVQEGDEFVVRDRWSSSWRYLIALGGFAFLGLMGEGSMGDWSAVYLRRSLGASPALAGLGYAAYSFGMTAGRLTGDRMSRRLGDVTLLRLGASLATFGLLVAVGIGRPDVAVAGFALVGVGLANVVPVLYRAAARTPGVTPVTGIATTSTVGYLGFLAGPPVIGLIAWQTTLGTAFVAIGAAIGMIAIGGRLVSADRVATDPVRAGSPRILTPPAAPDEKPFSAAEV